MAQRFDNFVSIACLQNRCVRILLLMKDKVPSPACVVRYRHIQKCLVEIMQRNHVQYEYLLPSERDNIDQIREFLRYVQDNMLPIHWNIRYQFDHAVDKFEFMKIMIRDAQFEASIMFNEFWSNLRPTSLVAISEFLDSLYSLWQEMRGTDEQFQSKSRSKQRSLLKLLDQLTAIGTKIIQLLDIDGNLTWPLLDYFQVDNEEETPQPSFEEDLKIVEDADANNSHMTFTECCICRMDFEEGQTGVYPYTLHLQSQCLKHKFHHQCIMTWLRASPNKCPFCRE